MNRKLEKRGRYNEIGSNKKELYDLTRKARTHIQSIQKKLKKDS